MIKSNQLYDKLKFVAQILLPSLGTLYYALALIWKLPNAEQVSGSVLAVDAFLGAILGLSNVQYKNDPDNFDGDLIVDDGTPGPNPDTTAVYNEHPKTFKDNAEVRLRVKRVDTSPKRPSQGR